MPPSANVVDAPGDASYMAIRKTAAVRGCGPAGKCAKLEEKYTSALGAKNHFEKSVRLFLKGQRGMAYFIGDRLRARFRRLCQLCYCVLETAPPIRSPIPAHEARRVGSSGRRHKAVRSGE